jgi:hypothetical protein
MAEARGFWRGDDANSEIKNAFVPSRSFSRPLIVKPMTRFPLYILAAATIAKAVAATEQAECLLCEVTENHHSRQVIRLAQPVTTDCLEILLVAPEANVRVALFGVRYYA